MDDKSLSTRQPDDQNMLIPPGWVQLSLIAKGARRGNYATGWEWARGPMPILRYLRALMHTLNAIEKTGSPLLSSGD